MEGQHAPAPTEHEDTHETPVRPVDYATRAALAAAAARRYRLEQTASDYRLFMAARISLGLDAPESDPTASERQD